MSKLAAYYAVLKPERTFANVLTTGAGFLLACAWHIDWSLFLATIVGTSLIVASACAVNNATDRGIDAMMPRTNKRALVVGDLAIAQVLVLAVVLGVAGFWLLASSVNWLTVLVGAIGYIDYVVLYSWTKRRTPYSTLVGTISGAAPLVAGYTAVSGQFDLTAGLLGAVMIAWQMAHFFTIAMYRRDDYAKANLPVYSVVYGQRRTQLQIVLYIGLLIGCLLALSAVGDIGSIGLLILLPLMVHWLWLGFEKASISYVAWGKTMFASSLGVLLVLSAVLSVGGLLP